MKKWLIPIGAAAGLAAVYFGIGGFGGSGGSDSDLPLARVQQGDLVIDVLEGGNLQALSYMEIRNEVRANSGVKILEIIEEGYMVTDEDVAEGKVLVRLDPSSLEEEIVDHDVQFQQTEAAYAEAKQNIEIEESNSLSSIKTQRQNLRFALLDFQKFVGAQAAEETLKALNLPYDNDSLQVYEEEATEIIARAFDTSLLAESASSSEEDELNPFEFDEDDSLSAHVDFAAFLRNELLGDGEAEQTIRRMRDEALVAASQLAVVEESVEGAKRLHEREFITRQTLDNEMVSLDKARLALQRSETELELFRDYEFPKEAEKMLSRYEETLLTLIRTKRERMARMSQVYARYRSTKRRYELELQKRENLEEQLASCVIRAEIPGLVAYGGPTGLYSNRNNEAIAEGATLRTGQPIITVPDMSRLGVEINIHESHIKKVEIGQKVYVTADAVPDRKLVGRVSKVAVLPDSNASRYNPSLKVYPATVEIEGTHEFLMPGMSAKVEIIVDELEDVTYVPVQSVFVENDEHFVFLRNGRGYTRHPVTVGAHNNDFVQIREGLEGGDEVFLRMPEGYEPSRVQMADRDAKSEPEASAPQATTEAATADENA